MLSLLLIGGGNMGGAIVRGAVAQRVFSPGEIGVVEIDAARRESLHAETGCRTLASAGEALDELNKKGQIILAVKPQIFADVAQDLTPVTGPRVVISIMAGIDSGRIHHALGPQARIVRCMPNTPCQIGKGMTAIALGMGAREGDERLARSLFDALGKTVMLDESLLDAVTAVSSSGAAYIFLMAEAMQAAAEAVDLPRDDARLLVKQMIVGAAAMLDQKGADAAALRRAVTSPHGTTEAALRVFERADFERIVREAVIAARDRGRDLGRGA